MNIKGVEKTNYGYDYKGYPIFPYEEYRINFQGRKCKVTGYRFNIFNLRNVRTEFRYRTIKECIKAIDDIEESKNGSVRDSH